MDFSIEVLSATFKTGAICCGVFPAAAVVYVCGVFARRGPAAGYLREVWRHHSCLVLWSARSAAVY
eukprot:28563-Lingulodinium_polyedra.AAC.1